MLFSGERAMKPIVRERETSVHKLRERLCLESEDSKQRNMRLSKRTNNSAEKESPRK